MLGSFEQGAYRGDEGGFFVVDPLAEPRCENWELPGVYVGFVEPAQGEDPPQVRSSEAEHHFCKVLVSVRVGWKCRR
jgi:hypothetical protein